MIAGTVWNQLYKTIDCSPVLNKYIKYVYEGLRFDLEPESLPCIMLEPLRNNEIIKEMNNVKDIEMSVGVYGFSSANYNKNNKTIVGDFNYKGILDMENDVRALLQSSNHLGDTAIDTKFDPTEFDISEVDKYPVRGFLMPIRIQFRQFDGE